VTRPICPLALLLALAGCAGDPALYADGAVAASGRPVVARDRWEPAAAGCEDVPRPTADLFACEGEPELGALVDEAGEVLCVDAMSILDEALPRPRGPDPLAYDPSPQPSLSGVGATPVSGSSAAPTATAANGARADPTPTPVVRADPDPQRADGPTLLDPTPTPVVQPERDPEDPTPTPTTDP